MSVYLPTEKQQEAHSRPEQFLLFGGALGGGKTAWLCNEAIYHCLAFPGSRVYLARHQLSSFKKTTLLTLGEFLPFELIMEHNKSDCFFTFTNGSQLYYGGLGDDLKAIQKLKSMELSAYGIDQAEETTEDFFYMLNSRLRLKIPGVKYRAWLTANPTSNWVRTRFIEQSLDDHYFIPALPKDNPFLPPDYEHRLRQSLPEELVQAWVEGNWDIISEENSLFSFAEIDQAMKCNLRLSGSECLGVDPARFGRDETVFARKKGNVITIEKVFSRQDTMTTTGEIIRAINRDKSFPVKLDSIGVGGGIADRLREQEYKLIEVIASAKAIENTKYKNKRAEDYFNLKSMLPNLKLPNDSKLRSQMMAIRYRIFSDGLLIIESKEDMKRRGVSSPDRLDAVVIACSGEGEVGKVIPLPPPSLGISKSDEPQKVFIGDYTDPIPRSIYDWLCPSESAQAKKREFDRRMENDD